MKKQNRHVKHLPKNQTVEIFGWVSAAAILTGYALLSLNIIDGNSATYHLIFLVGSVGLAMITYRHRAFQSFFVNMTFILLALIALFRILFLA